METGDELPSFENTLSKPQDLTDHLTWQLDMSHASIFASPSDAPSSAILNEDGYLRASVEEIQQMGTSPPTRCGPPSR
jgi:DNA-directed RNA polymerase specialized sigma54-like protein